MLLNLYPVLIFDIVKESERFLIKEYILYAKRDKKFYGDNPVTVSGLMTEDNLRDRVLSFEEEERLMASSASHLIRILETALNTGMRKAC